MRSTIRTVLAMTALAACSKSGAKSEGDKEAKATEPTAKSKPSMNGAPAAAATDKPTPVETTAPSVAGVEAGGIAHAEDEGPAAVVGNVSGTVEVQRLGETTKAPAAAGTKLYAGDRVITADKSAATITMADQSVVEVSEASAIAIATRDGTADPASAVAVLSGLARFTVEKRAPGEGPFRVYTPAGMVVTEGTVYGVGVGASGDARVGVESGQVDVVGLAALDAAPIEVAGGNSVALAAAGTVDAPAAWGTDDWGTWRDTTDATVDVGVALDTHAAALAVLETQLADTYGQLDASAQSVASFEASAATAADSDNGAAYTASLPEGDAAIDASFALGGRAEALTWAHAAHAQLATDLYVRHPDVAGPKWTVLAPRVDAAVLWPKRFEIAATGYLEPLRVQYYVHDPIGRVHAPYVGVTVPAFYASVEPPPVEPPAVRAHVHGAVWVAAPVAYIASPRAVWIGAPSADWHASVHVNAAPPRAHVGWYVRPPELHAHAIVAIAPTASYTSSLHIGAPAPRATIAAAWHVPVGIHVHVVPPDLEAAAHARVGYHVGAGVHAASEAAGGVEPPHVESGAGVHVGVGVAVPPPPSVHVHAGAAAGAGVRAGGGVRAGVRVQVPKVKIKVPSVKIHAGAGISIH